MTTTVTKTVGTAGADYTTIQAWEDASPANLVSSDQIWRGEQITNLTGSGGTMCTFAGVTTDATRYMEFTVAATQSYVDNASIQTNALRFNGSNGLTITNPTAYASIFIINDTDYIKISRIQGESTNNSGGCIGMTSSPHLTLDQCIFEGKTVNGCVTTYGGNLHISNVVIIQRRGGQNAIVSGGGGSQYHNCTFVCPSDLTAASYGNKGSYAGAIFKNCVFMGCSALWVTGSTPTFTNCITSVAGNPNGTTTVTYDTAAFVNITDSTRDFRIPSGSALIDAGTTDASYASIDIAGTSRPQGAAYDVGAWEYKTAAATNRFQIFMLGGGI